MPDNIVPTPQPVIPTPPSGNNKTLITVFSVIVALLLVTVVTLAYQNWKKQTNQPTTYEECIKFPGSLVQERYQATCVTVAGASFRQPLTEEEQENLLPPDPTAELETDETDNANPQFCGGIAGIICPEGYDCNYDGDYPDAGGTCIKN